jgi:hypothetical protein
LGPASEQTRNIVCAERGRASCGDEAGVGPDPPLYVAEQPWEEKL